MKPLESYWLGNPTLTDVNPLAEAEDGWKLETTKAFLVGKAYGSRKVLGFVHTYNRIS
jgi:hypothetical protein